MAPPPPTLAVVEDNADNRLLLQAILGDEYDLVEYENGADALDGFARSKPDLVLLDISLPGMDGKEILQRIRHDLTLRNVPVIALTAHAMAGDREKFLAAGFDDYITKPIVDENQLFAAIKKLLTKP
ncbi:MAG TPA: response regulator [Gemmatimonadaceae bacterium]|jgi:two-component system cell cycle response regulator DivK